MFAPEVTDVDQVSRHPFSALTPLKNNLWSVHVIANFLNGGMIAIWAAVAVDQ
jgi:hypothetical protein